MIMVDRAPLFWTALVALGAILTTWAASVLTAVQALAQPPAAQTCEMTSAGVPLARARRVVRGPDVDGDVPGDAVWDGAPVLTGFRQTTPDEEEPRVGETVKTQVSRTFIVSFPARRSSWLRASGFSLSPSQRAGVKATARP